MSLAQILRRVAPEEQHDVQLCRNSSVSYHVNMAPCVMCDEGITIQHNAHFRDKRCQKWRQHLLHRVDHVTVSRFCLARTHPLSPLLQAQNIASPKWLPTTYAPGLSKTTTCAAYYMDRFNYKYSRPSYFLL